MDFMQWALAQAQAHPALAYAIVTADGDWLDILLADGKSFRFRPGAMIKETAPEPQRIALLARLIDIGIQQAGEHETPSSAASKKFTESTGDPYGSDLPATKPLLTPTLPASLPDEDDTPIVPIVRSADYFIKSHYGDDSMVYVPLTDFVGVGLAFDLPDAIQPLYYSQIEQDSSDTGMMLAESVNALRRLAGHRQLSVEIVVAKIAGAEVISLLQPDNYELSWMCDVEMMMQISEHIRQRHPDDIPLFIPAARTKLYAVFSEDPHLADFFKILLAQRGSSEAVYPLPHTIAADGWKEWVPLPGSPLAEVLGSLRHHFRENIYATQVECIERNAENSQKNFGALKAYTPQRLRSGERVSCTSWDSLDGHGSIPDTDFITFMRAPSPHPWEDSVPVQITIRSHIAREIWPEGIVRDETFWPPRWKVTGFPDDQMLARLAESADREF